MDLDVKGIVYVRFLADDHSSYMGRSVQFCLITIPPFIMVSTKAIIHQSIFQQVKMSTKLDRGASL